MHTKSESLRQQVLHHGPELRHSCPSRNIRLDVVGVRPKLLGSVDFVGSNVVSYPNRTYQPCVRPGNASRISGCQIVRARRHRAPSIDPASPCGKARRTDATSNRCDHAVLDITNAKQRHVRNMMPVSLCLLVCDRFVCAIDDHILHRPAPALEPQPKLLLHRSEDGRPCRDIRLVRGPIQMNIV
jgi:hypothetical protein